MIKKIRKHYNVIYHRGIFGIRIIPRDHYNPMFELLSEDDICLQTSDKPYPTHFDTVWADDFTSVLEDAKGYVKSHLEKFGVIKKHH